MKKIKNSVSSVIASALIWPSLPGTAFAQIVGIAENVRPQASGMGGLPSSTQVQLALNINAFFAQPNLSSSLFVPNVQSRQGRSPVEPEKLVSIIGGQISAPGATPVQIAAGKAILAALVDHDAGARIIADLQKVDDGRHADVGKQAAAAMSALVGNYSDSAARSAASKAVSNLRLNMPASLDALFDGLRTLDKKDLKAEDSASGVVVPPQSADGSRSVRKGSMLSRWTPRRSGRTAPAGIDALDEKTVGLAAKFIAIKPGRFQMGSPSDQEGRFDDESPHTVRLTGGFEMQATPVTQLQYFLAMGENPSHFKTRQDGDPNDFKAANGQAMNANHPVERVSWFDAILFANKLSELQGLKPAYLIERNWDGVPVSVKVNGANIYETEGYRLPTEGEWEYAARAGTPAAFPYSFGHNDANELDHHAWHTGNSGGRTHAVAGKKANPWGLYDIHGNVSEWVQDWSDAYPSEYTRNPTGPSNRRPRRVIRGGSWNNDARKLRSAFRIGGSPFNRFDRVGFRLVRSRR